MTVMKPGTWSFIWNITFPGFMCFIPFHHIHLSLNMWASKRLPLAMPVEANLLLCIFSIGLHGKVCSAHHLSLFESFAYEFIHLMITYSWQWWRYTYLQIAYDYLTL
jgi:hypothetical protein